MPSVPKVIGMIEKRPGMYLGELSLSRLESFLAGYEYCAHEIEPSRNYREGELYRFGEWIRSKYNVTSSHGWQSIIRYWSGDDAGALENFFKLWREFAEVEKIRSGDDKATEK